MVHVTLVANTAESVFGAQAERAGGHLCIQLREQVSVVRATQKRVCKCCCFLTNSPHVSRCYAGPQNRKLGTMGGSRSLDAALDFVEMHLVLLDSFVATSSRYDAVYCVLECLSITWVVQRLLTTQRPYSFPRAVAAPFGGRAGGAPAVRRPTWRTGWSS